MSESLKNTESEVKRSRQLSRQQNGWKYLKHRKTRKSKVKEVDIEFHKEASLSRWETTEIADDE